MTNTPKILLCEDEENIVSFLLTELQYEGFSVDVAYDGGTALQLFEESSPYDLILLDIMLPVKNGLECLREIRKTSPVPVIILTARKEVYDKVAFLNAGADDYITKPFDTLELIARIKRNIERTKVITSQVPQEATPLLSIHKESYRALVGDNLLNLTKTEFEMLLYLYENADKVKTRNEIIQAIFGEFYGESNIVDANIKNIRAKISAYTDEPIICTVRGKGYMVKS